MSHCHNMQYASPKINLLFELTRVVYISLVCEHSKLIKDKTYMCGPSGWIWMHMWASKAPKNKLHIL